MTHPATREMFAASAALQALNDALQGARRPALRRETPLDRVIATMDVRAAETARKVADTQRAVIESGAAMMVRQPWRITRAVYLHVIPREWPVQGKTAAEVLADCRQLIDAEVGRVHHWSHSGDRLIALRQAELALERMVEGAS